jgi:tetratricopeptide (TPR) repeat protein
MTSLILLLITILVDPSNIAQQSVSARAHLGEGNRLMQMERFKEAAQEFEQALHRDSRLVEAQQQLAVCQFELRNYDVARTLFQQMLQAKEHRVLATYYLGRLDLLQQDYQSAIQQFRSLRSAGVFRDELYHLGVAYFKTGRFSEAAHVLRQAIADNFRDYRCHQFLARSYQKLGETRKAEEEFAETQRLHDYYLKGSVAISECRSLLLEGQPKKAWDKCQPLLETDDVDKLVSIGILFGKSGEYRRALEAWEKAVSLDPDSSEVHYNVALTSYHLKDMSKARYHAEIAVGLRPNFFEANMLSGTIFYMLAEDDRAIQSLTRAHELRPDDDGARKLLAQQLYLYSDSLIRKNELDRAVQVLRRATELRPDSEEIAGRLAQLLDRMSSKNRKD